MDRLKETLAQIEKQQRPPVDKWHPEHVGKIDIRIDTQGFWFHEGDPISREKLVRLFASILWFEKEAEGDRADGLNQSLVTGRYYLVTPVEKLAIGPDDQMGEDSQGGFFCPCHGSKFDLSGRVYKNKPAPTNLDIPPHFYESDSVILIGEDGGNA